MKRLQIGIIAFLLPILVVAAETNKTSSNTVQVLWPYKTGGIWAFDDYKKGLYREPFVAGINPMIDSLVTNIPDATIGFRLMFSDEFIPEYNAKLVWRRPEGKGNWYYYDKTKTEGWLCGSLLKYYSKAPKEIYIKVEAMPKEY